LRDGFACFVEERRDGTLVKRWRRVASAPSVEGTLRAEAGPYTVYGLMARNDREGTHTRSLADGHRLRGIRNGVVVTVIGNVVYSGAPRPPHVVGVLYEGSPAALLPSLRARALRLSVLAWGLTGTGLVSLALGTFFVLRRRRRAVTSPPRLAP
jgi:hypothetical protein